MCYCLWLASLIIPLCFTIFSLSTLVPSSLSYLYHPHIFLSSFKNKQTKNGLPYISCLTPLATLCLIFKITLLAYYFTNHIIHLLKAYTWSHYALLWFDRLQKRIYSLLHSCSVELWTLFFRASYDVLLFSVSVNLSNTFLLVCYCIYHFIILVPSIRLSCVGLDIMIYCFLYFFSLPALLQSFKHHSWET